MGFWGDVFKAGVQAALGQIPGGQLIYSVGAKAFAEGGPGAPPPPDDRPAITLDSFFGPPAYWIEPGPFNDWVLGTGWRTPVSHPTVVIFEWAMPGLRNFLETELQARFVGKDPKALADELLAGGSYDGMGNWHVTLGADLGGGEMLEVSRDAWWKPKDPRGRHARRALGRLCDGRVGLFFSLQRGYGFDLVELGEDVVKAHPEVFGYSASGTRLALPLTNEAAAWLAQGKMQSYVQDDFGWPAELRYVLGGSAPFNDNLTWPDTVAVLTVGGLNWLVDRSPPAFVSLDPATPHRGPVLRNWTLLETFMAQQPVPGTKLPVTWSRPTDFVDGDLADHVDALLPWQWSDAALKAWKVLWGTVPSWGRMGVSPSTMLTGPTLWGDRSLWARTTEAMVNGAARRSYCLWVALMKTQLTLYKPFHARFEQEAKVSAWAAAAGIEASTFANASEIPRPQKANMYASVINGVSWGPDVAADAARRHVALADWALHGAAFPSADWDYPDWQSKQKALVNVAKGLFPPVGLSQPTQDQAIVVIKAASGGDPGPTPSADGTTLKPAVVQAMVAAHAEYEKAHAKLPGWVPWVVGAGIAGGLVFAFGRKKR